MNGEVDVFTSSYTSPHQSSGHLFVYSDGTTAMIHYCGEHQSFYDVARLPTQSNESIIGIFEVEESSSLLEVLGEG